MADAFVSVTPLPSADREGILRLFREGTAEERQAFVASCPPHLLRDGAGVLARSEDSLGRVMALGILATAFAAAERATSAPRSRSRATPSARRLSERVLRFSPQLSPGSHPAA